MNNTVFGKTMENVRKLRDIKVDGKVSVPSCQITRFFTEHLLALEMKENRNTCG